MKIALICPSNIIYMPYINCYKELLEINRIDYDIINWDRFNIEEHCNETTYRDSKIGHKRNYFDYLGYKKFIKKKLNKKKYNKIIVFGIQLTYFLKKYLLSEFKNNYIIDIRDHNQIIKFFNLDKLIKNSAHTVISSPGYKIWLPQGNDYLINHNIKFNNLKNIENIEKAPSISKVDISCIGAIRDYKINIELINALKNNNRFNISFHGEGDINKNLKKYIEEKNITNVNLSGRYNPVEEESLYSRSGLINVLRYNDGINNETALPNRLYNAALYGKPMIAFKGTQLSSCIEEYNLGLVIESFEDIETKIENYLKEFNMESYNHFRFGFFKKVINDNNYFIEKIETFIQK